MGRPKKTDPRERAAYARLSTTEWEIFEWLIADRQRELRVANEDPSVELSQGDVIRWLILREAASRRCEAGSQANVVPQKAAGAAKRKRP